MGHQEKSVEQKLRESNDQLRMIIESAKEYVIFSLDLDRKVTSWNSGAQAILGYTPDEIIGQSADVIFTEEDRFAGVPEREASRAIAQGRAEDERWHLHKDGTRIWSCGAMMALRDQDEKVVGLFKIFRDRTEQIRSEAQTEQHRKQLLNDLERARAQAEDALQAKDHFLAILSHELRTPLTPILVVVGALNRRDDLPDRVREGLDMIRRNVEIESHFVDDLLDLTRITRHQFEINCKSFDVHRAILDAVDISQPDLSAKKQQLTTALEASSHVITGDETRVQQVIWNLLKNASKFTPEYGKIHIATRNHGEQIQIVVTDTGIGIEDDVLSRIFEAFIQGGSQIAREYGGLGLGLAISKATIDAHGGTIKAQSLGRDQGAIFTIELPPRPSAPEPRTAVEGNAPSPT